MYFTIPIWVAYERQFLTLSQFTSIEAIIFGIQLILELPTGAFADLFGKRCSVVLGGLFSVMSLVIYAFSTSYIWFIVYAVLSGIGGAFISGSQEALLYDSLKEDGKEDSYDKVNSKLEVLFQISVAAATIIGGIIGAYSYIIPIWLTTSTFLLCTVVSLLFKEPHIDTEKFTLQRYVRQTKIGTMELVKNRHIALISSFYILVGFITWVCQLVFNLTLLTEVGQTTMEIGIIAASVRIINSIVLFKLVHIGTLLTKSRTFLMFPLVMIIALLPGVFLSRWVVIPSVALMMFLSTARWVILSKYTNQEFSSQNRSTAISALSMGISIFYVLILILSGPVMEKFGGVKMIYTLLGILSLITVLPLGVYLAKIHKNETVR